MTAVVSNKERIPVELSAGGVPYTYTFRVPTVFDRKRLRRAVASQKAVVHAPDEIQVYLKEGLTAIYEEAGDPDEAARCIGVVDALYEKSEQAEIMAAEGLEMPDGWTDEVNALARDVREIELVVKRHYQPYAELLADVDFAREIMGLEAIRMCLLEIVKGEGEAAVRHAFGQTGPTDAQFSLIPDAHQITLAQKALSLFSPTGDAEKK